jgi:uncharacterized protein
MPGRKRSGQANRAPQGFEGIYEECMEITEQEIHLLTQVEQAVQESYRDFADLAHGFEHVQRVYHLAMQLSEQERADGFVVGMAALLHDVGRTTRGPTHSHAERSAKLAKQLLTSYGLTHERQQPILHAIWVSWLSPWYPSRDSGSASAL